MNASTSTSVSERIPVTIIGGYLGAGKTSLLSHLLTRAGGERIVALINDFGALGIDAALVALRDAETVTLTNGCVCCSIADDFGAALDAQVRSPEPPGRIVVEASGVADPGKSARYALGWPGLRLDAVITVVDLDTVRTQSADRFTGNLIVRQIESADVIVANKSDRVEAPDRRSTLAWLARNAPRAGIVEACHGRVDPAIVLGPDTSAPDALTAGATVHGPPAGGTPAFPGHHPAARTTDDGPLAGGVPAFPGRRPASRAADDADAPFVRATSRTHEPLDRTRLAAALDALPASVVRFKGFVRLHECPGRLYVLQGVGHRWSLEPVPEPSLDAVLEAGGGSAIDLIGVGPAAPIESAARMIALLPASSTEKQGSASDGSDHRRAL